MSAVVEVTSENFTKIVLESILPVAAVFYGSDCPGCASVLPLFERIAKEYSGKLLFVRINKNTSPELAKQYRIRSRAAVLFFLKGKEVCPRLLGYLQTDELKRILDDVLNGKYDSLPRDRIACDVLILGSGPAGLTAAIYATRGKLYTVVVDTGFIGGQVALTWQVENYPGTNGAIRGADLVANMRQQAVDFGAEIHDMQEVVGVQLAGPVKALQTKKTDYFAKALIIATGAQPRKLKVAGEEAFTGKGVHYCATCDGALYQDADILVVGGGDAAVEEAVFLTRFAKKVTLIHRRGTLSATKTAQDALFKNSAVEVLYNREIVAIHGDQFVNGVTLRDVETGETFHLPIDGIFIYIGTEPKSRLFEGQLALNEGGYIVTDEKMQTSCEGVFAAGDVRAKEVRQITTAVADGTIAGIMAGRYLQDRQP